MLRVDCAAYPTGTRKAEAILFQNRRQELENVRAPPGNKLFAFEIFRMRMSMGGVHKGIERSKHDEGESRVKRLSARLQFARTRQRQAPGC